ncbi:MAG: hypothetical protein M1294_04150 [Firmicutes bacterium]|jgi:ssDNA-binding Zn-finger/Zn-ribbon topoisomerase 1|uniref:DNA topoisomerase type IA zn finger domain-containing protein n=1 Tax=Sulfobacillus benefaciens TaxID=453960 RepID=A0A2T2X4G9_9FIRM|nr:hypothetical protein [Bacillota bacterium]MCL5013718.1 hypothetical protein [Bacillota bacterium]PSR29394.1 MAG: hypothetical protein C7B43_08620 [Sulfobacillus benefaciens]
MVDSLNDLCPICHQFPVRHHTLHLTGDAYEVCDNYPECRYVSRLDTREFDWASVTTLLRPSRPDVHF